MIKHLTKKESAEAMKQSQSLIHRNDMAAIEQALIHGDLAGLNISQRLTYVKSVCKSVKLNPLTKPFDYIKFEGKVLLYINRGGTEQLRMIHKISTKVVSREFSKEHQTYDVVVRAIAKDGREEESLGSVSIAGLRGKEFSNAKMKCETKAKRRATLAICGLSVYDSPSGEEEPIKQTQIVERIEEVSEKTETEARPEFETVPITAEEPPAVSENLPPVPTQDKGYVIKAGRCKGRLLNDLSKNWMEKQMAWYAANVAAGKACHPDVQDDIFNIKAHLETPPPQE